MDSDANQIKTKPRIKQNPLIPQLEVGATNILFLSKHHTLHDPSIGQASLIKLDVIGVLIGHFIFAFAITLFFYWDWIPLTPEEQANGKSLNEIKKVWGWGD